MASAPDSITGTSTGPRFDFRFSIRAALGPIPPRSSEDFASRGYFAIDRPHAAGRDCSSKQARHKNNESHLGGDMRFLRTLIHCLACLLLLAVQVSFAQVTGRITGSVVDQSGAVIPGARIKI